MGRRKGVNYNRILRCDRLRAHPARVANFGDRGQNPCETNDRLHMLAWEAKPFAPANRVAGRSALTNSAVACDGNMKNTEDADRAAGDRVKLFASDDDGGTKFPARFYKAIRKRDPRKVRELAKQAGTQKWTEAVRPLSEFLAPTSPRWFAPRSRKRGWSEARAAAVWALEQIGDPLGFRALTRTLACDPDFVVREAALAAVQSLEAAATSSLIEVVHEQVDWELDGMRHVLTALAGPEELSGSDRRAVGMALTDVLYENFPPAPRRWTRPARQIGKATSLLVMLTLAVAVVNSAGWTGGLWTLLMALAIAWIPGQIAGLITRLFASVLCTAVQNQAERKELITVAADSLVRLNDKRAIPGMLQLAFDAPLRTAGRQARIVLAALLPQVRPQDAALFSLADFEIMNIALAQPLDPVLTMALLHTIESVGNGTSIRRVQRLTRRGRTEEIRMRAAQVLEVLQAREARLKASQLLLRGANAPSAGADEMLRAAMPHRDDQTEELLRATHGEQV